MKKKSKQPHLAAANQPFTPMSHKNQNVAGTPFHPLQLNDLATPKINKSNSNVEKVLIEDKIESSSRSIENNISQPQQPQSHSQVDTQSSSSEIKELKQALLNCIKVIDRMEKNKKTYKNASTQCQTVKPALNSKPSQKKIASGAENNSNNNQFEIEKQRVKIRRQPSSDNYNRKETSISNSAGDSDLQDQINSMSLMLKNLQARIDLIDKSSHV